ncbi:Hvo_1808 family surface protein [Natronobacterium texcoconense]|uniref:DUF4157 domain-containing protein n=1 Tax=Natronobacterium texcoconense TaxID=1095778 RepID=A0A1H0YZP4_NATTX|nr:Hvo_1808 family surface protein [Natronobacterium texcoconense]SDQ20665.1 hypothetical protein SAMN04489842_0075 [Natronobacterium texcoconense]
MTRRRLALCSLVVLVGLVALAGCTLPESPDEFDTDREVGYVGDYAHDDEFAFDGDEPLTEAQLEDVKYRSMARIEVVRGLKFHHDVDLEVITRSELRDQRSASEATAAENELWRGTFVVDGETDVATARDDLYGTAVQGYYVNDRIVVVTDDTEEIRIDRGTLVHELTHALQDQQFGLARYSATLDERRAEDGLIEGEANYVPELYDDRCETDWQCIPERASTGSEPAPVDRPFNVGLFLSIYAPYSEGPAFVGHLHEREGWDAVDDAYDDRPASTSQIIHPERYPDDGPVEVDLEDRSSDDWEPVTRDGEPHAETVGEATLFATLWANGVVDRPLTEGGTERSPYNYSYPATDGWAGDAFQVYEDGDRTGHVWRLVWQSDEDADTFADAYRTLLENNEGESVENESVYRIPDDEPFAGAYRIEVAGDTVEIVGAPTVDDLEAIGGEQTVTDGTATTIDPPQPATPAATDSATARAAADG